MEKNERGFYRALIAAFVAALGMKIFLFDFMIAEGHSMVPAVKPGSVLLVLKPAYGIRLPGGKFLLRWAKPEKGQIVVFYTPSGDIAVKRVGAVEGDDFIALGDNSLLSYDSRSYGPVSEGNIIGRVLGIK